MVQLVYASAATVPFSDSALATLLEKSNARNSMYKVTGMLLYHSGSFLQVLEGQEKDVEKIFNSIARDPRHSNTKVLRRGSIARREFDQWAMGFVNTSKLRVPGLVDYERTLPSLTLGSGDAARYLRFFHEGLCRQTAPVAAAR